MVKEDYIQLPYEVQVFMASIEKIPVPLHDAEGSDEIPPGARVYWTTSEEWAKFQEAYSNIRENFLRWFLYEIECRTFCKGFVPISPAAKAFLDAGGITTQEYFRRKDEAR